jgi:hypothetical protein
LYRAPYDGADVDELARLAKSIRRWERPILRWRTTRLTNATVEGTNLVVKDIKRLSVDRLRLPELRELPTPPPLQHNMANSISTINTTPPTTLGRVGVYLSSVSLV